MIGVQLSLPEITSLLSTSHNSIGNMGEAWLAQKLQQRGYLVRTDHERGDLTAIDRHGVIFCVEVKTARATVDGSYRFTLRKKSKTGQVKADHRKADIIALLCVMPSGSIVPFIVPISFLYWNSGASIASNPRTYAGRLAQWRQRTSRLSLHVY